MSDSSSNDLRPDLDESINVPEAHAALKDQPAAGREKTIRENGMEAVSLWLVLISAVVVLAAGAVMGQGGGFFGYDELIKDGYLRAKSPVPQEEAKVPIDALTLLKKEGKKVYGNCASCHQDSGLGQTGQFPPLAGSEWVLGSTEALSLIIHNGIQGPIEVAGSQYNGNMAAIGANLNAKELAALMTFIRNSWGNEASIVSPSMAANALEISKNRGGAQTTAEELKKSHDKMLTGDILNPETMLDPETWEPTATED
ncbi:cytochrome c [bacterium]|nr:cytochrome c [bacterium]